ncbi:hypothetical protein [Arthrobacter sp. Soil762]|uniref:hypothetical protein n=1 Tax=Arthrobacter sp. Soil762 TaxID=1736401 RepID=UPI001F29C521|nr:hypothetical protein [Arthrobacter sp. Soil762]
MSNPQGPYQPVQPAAWPAQPTGQPAQPTGQPGNPGEDGAPPLPGNPPQHGAPGQYGAPSQFLPPEQYGAPGQYSSQGPFGLPGQEPPAQSRRRLWTILGVVGGVLLLAVVGVLILVNIVNGATNHARGLADSFTKLVIAGDSSKAYDDYLDPALHEQLTKEDFIAGIKTLEMDSTCKTAYNEVKASTENGTKAADVAGLITCDGDKKIDLVYRFEGTDELKMINIKLKPQA